MFFSWAVQRSRRSRARASAQKGADSQQRLALTDALTSETPPQITIQEPRLDVAAVTPMGGAQRWIYADNPATVQHFTLDLPVLAAPEEVCGRVVFSDFHVLNARTMGSVFPADCDDMPLSAQEKVLEFAVRSGVVHRREHAAATSCTACAAVLSRALSGSVGSRAGSAQWAGLGHR